VRKFFQEIKSNILIEWVRVNNIYLILLIYSVYYLLTLIPAYPIFEDEAWYANAAYSFSHGDWVHTKLIGGGLPHFIFPVFEGIIFKVFGFSFYNARFTSFLFGFFSIIIFRSLLKYLNVKNHIIFIILLFFVFSPGYFFTFHIARPESAAVFFSLISILFFLKSTLSEKHVTKYICLCSLFSGIAFLSHPYTFPLYFIFGIYFLILSLKQKEYLNLVYFSIIALFIFFVFIANSYYLSNNFQLILDRTSANNSLVHNSGLFFKNFLNRRMLSLNGLFFLTFAILPGFIKWRNIKLRYLTIATLFYLIIVSFILSPTHPGNHYILNYIGLFTIISIAISVNIYDKGIALLICIFYLITYSILDIKKNHGNQNIVKSDINLLINSKIPPGAKVFGDIRFWVMLPKTNYTAIYWNRYQKSLKESISESEWIIVCNDFGYNRITNFDYILESIQDMNIKVDTVLNISTKQYGEIMVYKIY
jgi:hypothetical protein